MKGFDGPLKGLKDKGVDPVLKVRMYETTEECVFKYGFNRNSCTKTMYNI